MSSVDGESNVSGGSEQVSANTLSGHGPADPAAEGGAERPSSELRHIIEEEQKELGAKAAEDTNGTSFHGYRKVKEQEDAASEGSSTPLPRRGPLTGPMSPEGSISTPDDTPSIQGSALSSPSSSTPPSFAAFQRARPAPLQPFERRFSARITSSSSLGSPRADSPAFLNAHSRQSSLSSQIFQTQDESETPQPPWEVVRWTKLRKISGQAFSELGKRNFGRPTCLAVASSIILGTSKGLILVFDYHQTLKSIIGPGTKAIESGAVTALAISADHSTVAGGHSSGNIFTWELARPAKPFLHIPPLAKSELENRQSDGHVSDVSVFHLGFLGTRHTALVSADEGGMAFSHLATRGLGAMGRTVKTTRILGRYPPSPNTPEPARKASSVLAFSPLPLGNVEQPTDTLGLTALLTPYLLVIVSTTPIAETQHKATRPKELAPHGTLSGCLAWFPAVKLKNASGHDEQGVSKTKLVYCWSNILTVLDVDAQEHPEKNKPPILHFQPRSRWRAEEAIVAVQWLSRSVIGVLTISQQLVILEDNSLRQTDSYDLIQKHIFHQDLFSRQLHSVVEQHDERDDSLHGVVADAFYMSFRAFKGRLFLLGFNDVSIGTLSNWADRLLALMEEGDYIGALELATAYYNGDADKLTVGLPSDDEARQALVQEKLVDMLSASLRYTFSRNWSEYDETSRLQLVALSTASFNACLSMDEMDFLFEDVFEAFQGASLLEIFFDVLEPRIVEEEITSVPPDVLKDLITHYASHGRADRLEELICRLDTSTIDINQVTILCRQFNLYDALIYVWTRSLRDYITPLIDLLKIIATLSSDSNHDGAPYEQLMASAMKTFPYLAYTLTGRIYPGGVPLEDEEADEAKAALYSYIFSGKAVEWPKGSREVFSPPADSDDSFPYLRLILRFDTGSFMSMLNEAFEDSYLNGDQASSPNGTANAMTFERSSARRPTRQYILNILLGVMSDGQFDPEDTIYFYMFIARNLPKFPQYIILPGSTLHKLLEGLCDYPSEAVADDCQLSVEYLLSVYHPPDIDSLVPLFERAGFHRVLKAVFRNAKQHARLLEAYLNDPDDRSAVFDCIRDISRPNRGLSKKQTGDIHAVILRHALELATVDAARTARTIRTHTPALLAGVLDKLDSDPHLQFQYLRALLEPERQSGLGQSSLPPEAPAAAFVERFVQLMCKYEPGHVAEYVGLLRSGNLRLDKVLPAMESSGVIDAAVVLMAQDGLVRDAMNRLSKHLGTLETALVGLLEESGNSPDTANTEEAAADLLEAVHKYTKIGVWLCQGQTRAKKQVNGGKRPRVNGIRDFEKELDLDEVLWLDLLDAVVLMTKEVATAITQINPKTPPASTLDTAKISNSLRTNVQNTFSALLACMATAEAPKPLTHSAAIAAARKHHTPAAAGQPSPSFLRILRAFLTRASRASPSLSDLRTVLGSIFAAYAFESTILALANAFLDKDVFARLQDVTLRRGRGWRPKGNVCEGCRRRVWGPGVEGGARIWDEWERREKAAWRKRWERDVQRRGGEEGARARRGKGKAEPVEDEVDEDNVASDDGAGNGNGNGSGSAQSASASANGSGDAVGAGNGNGGTAAIVAGGGARKNSSNNDLAPVALQPLVVFACRHLWHRRCLESELAQLRQNYAEAAAAAGEDNAVVKAKLEAEDADGEDGRFRCAICVKLRPVGSAGGGAGGDADD
ncbi:Golgi CORVET complex core vacuolar protein 8-domain-containing protein [Phyllosticta capitalensis]|uniref:Golgi CORVET complex core vacuolar protein 8-domain-containing protein n=1 Tax=Phyllosticta capitalensis TaxID=121624 RepID=UPI00312DEF5D